MKTLKEETETDMLTNGRGQAKIRQKELKQG